MHFRIKVRSRKRKFSRLLTVFFLTLLSVGLGFEPGQARSDKNPVQPKKLS